MMELNTKRNKIILGSVVLGTILIILIITLSVSSSSNSCQLLAEIPEHKGYKPVKSQNNIALAKFSGYLVYKFDHETGKIYMPLEFKSVDLISLNDQKERRMIFKMDCSNIVFNLVTVNDESVDYHAYEVDIKLDKQNGVNKVCKMYPTQLGDFMGGSRGSHYACYEEKVYDCYSHEGSETPKLVARLVVQGLEFEVDGDKKLISEGRFSTPAKFCRF